MSPPQNQQQPLPLDHESEMDDTLTEHPPFDTAAYNNAPSALHPAMLRTYLSSRTLFAISDAEMAKRVTDWLMHLPHAQLLDLLQADEETFNLRVADTIISIEADVKLNDLLETLWDEMVTLECAVLKNQAAVKEGWEWLEEFRARRDILEDEDEEEILESVSDEVDERKALWEESRRHHEAKGKEKERDKVCAEKESEVQGEVQVAEEEHNGTTEDLKHAGNSKHAEHPAKPADALVIEPVRETTQTKPRKPRKPRSKRSIQRQKAKAAKQAGAHEKTNDKKDLAEGDHTAEGVADEGPEIDNEEDLAVIEEMMNNMTPDQLLATEGYVKRLMTMDRAFWPKPEEGLLVFEKNKSAGP